MLPIIENGIIDAHCHLDRGDTFEEEYFAHEGGLNSYIDASLPVKQVATGVLHKGPAYEQKSLETRMRKILKAKLAGGESVVYAIVDCSPDIDGRAFRAALKMRKEFASQGLDVRVGAYPIFGFKNFNSDRELHLRELAPKAQFIVGLPERDDKPDNEVGFDGHLAILIELAMKHRLELQVHVDQTNLPGERGTELLIQAVRWLVNSHVPIEKRPPRISAVHGISLSSESDEYFWHTARAMKKYGIDAICAAHAAISMRQIPSVQVPMHNSIIRLRELLLLGIKVRFGVDNIHDLFMPTPTSPLLSREVGQEYGVAQSAFRFYDKTVFAKLMRDMSLNETDIDRIEASLAADYAAAGWADRHPWKT